MELFDVWQTARCSSSNVGNGNEGSSSVGDQAVEFRFAIAKLFEDNTGIVRDVRFESESVERWLPSSLVSSTSTFFYGSISTTLRQSACFDDLEIAEVIKGAFTRITSILNKQENSKLNLVLINLWVLKRESWQEEDQDDWEFYWEEEEEEDQDDREYYWEEEEEEDGWVEAAMEETAWSTSLPIMPLHYACPLINEHDGELALF